MASKKANTKPATMADVATGVNRTAMSPIRSGGTGALTNGFSQAIVGWIIASNPELLPFAVIGQMAFHGIVGALGNAARNVAATSTDWKKYIGQAFSWLG